MAEMEYTARLSRPCGASLETPAVAKAMAGQAESTELSIFSIAVDLPSLKLWQGKEDGDGKHAAANAARTAK